MTQEIPEPTAADEQAKADLDTKVAADEETVAGDLRTEEAAHAQSQADLNKLAEDEAAHAVSTTTPTEAAPAADAGGTSDAASDPTNSQPSEPAATDGALDASVLDPTPGTADASAPSSPAPDATSQPEAATDGAGAPATDAGADTSTAPDATPVPDSTQPSDASSTEQPSSQPPSDATATPDDAGAGSTDAAPTETAFVPPANGDPVGAFTDAPTPAAGAPFDPSSGGGATDPTGSNDASDQGGNAHSEGQPTQGEAVAADAAPADTIQ